MVTQTKSLILPVLIAGVVLVLALALAPQRAASSGGKSSETVTGKTASDAIKNYAFVPVRLTVKAGTQVRWSNRDATAHTATADQGSFDTGTINPGQSKAIDFTRPGTYTYHCSFHAFMIGTITVVP